MEKIKKKWSTSGLRDSIETLKERIWDLIKPLSEIIKGSLTKTIVVLFILWFFCLTPIWFSGILILIASPDSFWQGFVMFLLLMVIFVIPQIILSTLAGMATFLIIDDQYQDGLMSSIINDNPRTNTKSASKKSKKYQPKEQNSEKTGFGIPEDD